MWSKDRGRDGQQPFRGLKRSIKHRKRQGSPQLSGVLLGTSDLGASLLGNRETTRSLPKHHYATFCCLTSRYFVPKLRIYNNLEL